MRRPLRSRTLLNVQLNKADEEENNFLQTKSVLCIMGYEGNSCDVSLTAGIFELLEIHVRRSQRN